MKQIDLYVDVPISDLRLDYSHEQRELYRKFFEKMIEETE